jgi:hypothetical protein
MTHEPPILVQRWPVAAVAPGDVIWSDKHGDWLTVERVERKRIDLPVVIYGPGEVIGTAHEPENTVLRRLPMPHSHG